jgi:hypothetical protein
VYDERALRDTLNMVPASFKDASNGRGPDPTGSSSTPATVIAPPMRTKMTNTTVEDHPVNIPHILPHERVFPIQIGSELFHLSGASLSSDGEPSQPVPCSSSSDRYMLTRASVSSAVVLLPVLPLPDQDGRG